jgi:hypothetical protein
MLVCHFPYRLTSDDGERMVLLHTSKSYNMIVTFLLQSNTNVPKNSL